MAQKGRIASHMEAEQVSSALKAYVGRISNILVYLLMVPLLLLFFRFLLCHFIVLPGNIRPGESAFHVLLRYLSIHTTNRISQTNKSVCKRTDLCTEHGADFVGTARAIDSLTFYAAAFNMFGIFRVIYYDAK